MSYQRWGRLRWGCGIRLRDGDAAVGVCGDCACDSDVALASFVFSLLYAVLLAGVTYAGAVSESDFSEDMTEGLVSVHF